MNRTNSTTKVGNTFKSPVVTHLCDTKMSGSDRRPRSLTLVISRDRRPIGS
jgi:hypothetical protein